MRSQFIVQMENRPGSLARLARALATRGVNIDHVSCGGTGPLGYASFSVDDEEAAEEVLRGMGQPYVRGESFTIELPDRPGALADVAERLADAGMLIHGVLNIGRRDGRSTVALAVDDAAAARVVLGIE